MAALLASASSVASGHSQASRSRDAHSLATGTTLDLDDAVSYEGTFEDTFESGTCEGSNSLTSSIEMRQEDSSVQSAQRSVNSRGAARGQDLQSGLQSLDRGQAHAARQAGGASTGSGSIVREALSLPSSFAGTDDRSTGSSRSGRSQGSRQPGHGESRASLDGSTASGRDGQFDPVQSRTSLASSGRSGSSRNSSRERNKGAMTMYNSQELTGGDANTSPGTSPGSQAMVAGEGEGHEDPVALKISQETKPMNHLLRLLKEMELPDGGGRASADPKGRARASLISDFEREVSLIEHRIKDEHLLTNGELPPLPPHWIALEDPDSGDVYYANEATGKTQWERPGLIAELRERLDDMKSGLPGDDERNMLLSNAPNDEDGGMQESHQSNTYDGGMQGSNRSNNLNAQDPYNNSQRSNMSDNSQRSNMSNKMNDSGLSNSPNVDAALGGSNNTLSLESSLTDSNNGEGLPPNWIALEDPDSGDTYFANEETGESTWDRPSMNLLPQSMPEDGSNASGSVLDNDDLPPDWVALEDADSGDTYYLNQVTNQTTWDRPTKDEGDSQAGSVADTYTDASSQEQLEATDASAASEHTSDLPPGWEAILDPSSGDYYFAHENGETTWDRPTFPGLSVASTADDDSASQQQSEFTEDEVLPPGWFAAVDEDSGDKYYCNEITGETTWDLPTAPATDNQSAADLSLSQDGDASLPPGWFAVTDPSSGDDYYVREETGETTWDRPQAENAENLMSRLSLNEGTVYEDDSVTSSQY
ncbi:hypothetical protein ACHAXT_008705 [Thalassiosira profunda]